MVGGSIHSSRWSSSGGGSPDKLFWGGCWSSGHDFWTAAAARRSHSPVTCCNHVPHLQELRKMNIIEAERDEDMYLTWCSVQVPVRVHSYEIQHCERISLSYIGVKLIFFFYQVRRKMFSIFLSFFIWTACSSVEQWITAQTHCFTALCRHVVGRVPISDLKARLVSQVDPPALHSLSMTNKWNCDLEVMKNCTFQLC